MTDGTSSITVAIVDGAGGTGTNYRIADNPDNSATVSVTDETRPVLTISTATPTVNEGESITFAVSLEPADPKVEYQFSISDTGNFVVPNRLGTFTKTTGASNYNEITVNTKSANTEFDPDSVVSVQLLPGQPLLNSDGSINTPAPYVIGESGSASVTVLDASTPTGGISILAYKDAIDEGSLAEFQLRSATPVSQPTSVIVEFTNDTSGRDYITQANLNRPSGIAPSADLIHVVVIPAGQSSVNFSVPTVDLADPALPSTITATLQTNPNSSYTLANSNTSASMSVVGDLEVPSVVFEVKTPEITEGEVAQIEFTLTSHNPSYYIREGGLPIDISVSQSGGNFLNFRGITGSGDQEVRFFTIGTTSYSILTQALNAVSPGTITITLNSDSTVPAEYARGASSNYTQTIIVNDSPAIPELSLSATESLDTGQLITAVNEGEIWQARVSINPPTPHPLTIWVTGTQSGDILATGRYSSQFDIKTGASEFIVRGTTVDDMTDEDDGTLTLTLRAQEGYTVDSDNDEVSFTIKDDDDAPVVSFVRSHVFSPEDVGNMRFDVQLSAASDKVVTIPYVAEAGTATVHSDSIPGDFSTSVTELVFRPGEQLLKPIHILIQESAGTSEPNESFTLKLTDGITNAQYVGGVDELVATGVITDNDNDSALPVISINNPRLSESGNQIFFRVNMSEAVTGETVDLTYVTSDGTAEAGSRLYCSNR